MFTFRLDDPHIKENIDAISFLLSIGFPEDQLQELYEQQVDEDLKEESKP